jgi:hypothetical protein
MLEASTKHKKPTRSTWLLAAAKENEGETKELKQWLWLSHFSSFDAIFVCGTKPSAFQNPQPASCVIAL